MVHAAEMVVVTARLLADGAPAYLDGTGAWSRSLRDAVVLPAAEGEKVAKERSQTDQRVVCDPYAFKVEVRGGEIDPLTARERIRANGPTIRMRRPD
jgi:sulfite reductase (NADPH) hemoprotein beta-component